MPVALAARRLGVSVPTVSSWIARDALLRAIKDSSPVEIEPKGLRNVSRALDELRERGQDRGRHHDENTARAGHAQNVRRTARLVPATRGSPEGRYQGSTRARNARFWPTIWPTRSIPQARRVHQRRRTGLS